MLWGVEACPYLCQGGRTCSAPGAASGPCCRLRVPPVLPAPGHRTLSPPMALGRGHGARTRLTHACAVGGAQEGAPHMYVYMHMHGGCMCTRMCVSAYMCMCVRVCMGCFYMYGHACVHMLGGACTCVDTGGMFVCVCMCLCMECFYICVLRRCVHMCMCVCVCVHCVYMECMDTHTCMYVCSAQGVCMHTRVNVHTCTYVCMEVSRGGVCVHTCVHVPPGPMLVHDATMHEGMVPRGHTCQGMHPQDTRDGLMPHDTHDTSAT